MKMITSNHTAYAVNKITDDHRRRGEQPRPVMIEVDYNDLGWEFQIFKQNNELFFVQVSHKRGGVTYETKKYDTVDRARDAVLNIHFRLAESGGARVRYRVFQEGGTLCIGEAIGYNELDAKLHYVKDSGSIPRKLLTTLNAVRIADTKECAKYCRHIRVERAET